MVDIQFATAEKARKEKKIERKMERRNHRTKI